MMWLLASSFSFGDHSKLNGASSYRSRVQLHPKSNHDKFVVAPPAPLGTVLMMWFASSPRAKAWQTFGNDSCEHGPYAHHPCW
jgi:hypothetical protein